MNSETILIILLFILAISFAIEKTIAWLNFKNLKKELPGEVEDIYDESKYLKSVEYSQANMKFGFLSSAVSFLLTFSLIALGFFGWLDGVLREFYGSEIIISLLFFGIIMLASDVLNIPFQLYDTFVIEEKFGFNKTDIKTFFTDKFKMYLIGALVGGLLLYVLLQLIAYFGPAFWWIFWLVITGFSLFMNMFYTSLLLPLFNKLTPLDDGQLKTAIEEYSQKVGFPLENIYVMDGSKRSSKSNAFFSGIGKKKKIVLYDTLVEKHNTEELLAVLAHEVGHYKKKHIISGILLSIIQTGAILYIMSRMIFSPELSLALGGMQTAIHLNMIAFAILFSPISMFIGMFMNVISRKNEFEADAFASETFNGKALQAALKKLSVNNLSNLTPHAAYVFFHYSHPPLLMRLRALKTAG
ncbi:MAG: M48 family metallopeptidase [Cyclobacteriaceae bacterium]|nr:M48 family metallopeptidase [Cyclobacteriaceae bacterium]